MRCRCPSCASASRVCEPQVSRLTTRYSSSISGTRYPQPASCSGYWAGTRRDQSSRREAGELCRRRRGNLRVLPASLVRAVARPRTARSVVARGVARQYRPGTLGAMLFKWRDSVADRPLRSRSLNPSSDGFRSARRPWDMPRSPSGSSIATSPSPTFACSRGGRCADRRVLCVGLHRPVGEGVQGNRHMGNVGSVLRLHDSPISVLHRAALGPARVTRDGCDPDQEQRTRRDEGMRHQPVSFLAADGGRCRRGRCFSLHA